MSRKDELLNQILATTHAPRDLLVEYIRLIGQGAKNLEQYELLSTSGAAQFRDPTTPGEKLASSLQHALISQESINWEDDPELAHIEAIAGELTDRTDDQTLWQELFERIEKL